MTNAGSLIIYHNWSLDSQNINLGLAHRPSVFMGSEHMSTLTILRASCFICFHGLSGETNIEIETWHHRNPIILLSMLPFWLHFPLVFRKDELQWSTTFANYFHKWMQGVCQHRQKGRHRWFDATQQHLWRRFFTCLCSHCFESFWI